VNEVDVPDLAYDRMLHFSGGSNLRISLEKMMKIPFYQVDAFTSEVFFGNPAGVCLLDSWIEDKFLQAIAAENNLSETAFLVRNKEGYELRW
jgi:hypothetical protein